MVFRDRFGTIPSTAAGVGLPVSQTTCPIIPEKL